MTTRSRGSADSKTRSTITSSPAVTASAVFFGKLPSASLTAVGATPRTYLATKRPSSRGFVGSVVVAYFSCAE